jgi:hypothetical protein
MPVGPAPTGGAPFTSVGEWPTSQYGPRPAKQALAVTFTRAYTANHKSDIEGIIDADPIAACVREFMSERSSWTGSAADLCGSALSTPANDSAGPPRHWTRNNRVSRITSPVEPGEDGCGDAKSAGEQGERYRQVRLRRKSSFFCDRYHTRTGGAVLDITEARSDVAR